jgi:hypothetical protein
MLRMLHNIGEWMEAFSWVQYLAHTTWLYIIISTAHYFTLLVMVGTNAFVDLRVLGLAARRKPLAQFADQIFPWMWVAFWLAVISGFLEFVTDAGDFLPDWVFRTKMLFILLAVVFTVLLRRSIPRSTGIDSTPTGAKVLAGLSLVCWLGSILWGVEIASISGLG